MEHDPGYDELDATVVVRNLHAKDLESVIALDAKNIGRRREEYFKGKLAANLEESSVWVSLAAEYQRSFAGFLLARVYYGEFGQSEPAAMLDTIGVDPDHRSKGLGRALMRQLKINLRALNVDRLRTEVDWADQELLHFFHHQGFVPAARLSLDVDLGRS